MQVTVSIRSSPESVSTRTYPLMGRTGFSVGGFHFDFYPSYSDVGAADGVHSTWDGEVAVDAASGVAVARAWLDVHFFVGGGEWRHQFDFAGKHATLHFRPYDGHLAVQDDTY